jgi:uncharacterized protein YbbC (DUF1343 family)/CubicO group peptidase (beta-lactamase class C family)
MKSVLCSTCMLVSSAMAADSPFTVAGVTAVKDLVSAAMKRGDAPGAVLWLEHGGKAEHWAQGARTMVPAATPMTESAVFDAASLTKVVATLPSVMLLVQDGKLKLSDPVKLHLPEMAAADVTLLDLLTHSSGLPAGISRVEPWSGYEEGIRRATACMPSPPPGHVFRYSDVNFILLGEVVRRVSSMSLDQFARSRVFQPLGMVDTGYKPGPELLQRVVPTEKDASGIMLHGVVHDPTSRLMGGVTGHAGLFTTAADLAKYARMWLAKGAPLFKPELVEQITSVQSPATVMERRGLGWDIDTRYSRPRGKLFPIGSFGHTGWTGTALWIDPASQTFFVFLSSRLHPDGKGDVRELYSQISTAVAQSLPSVKWADLPALSQRPEGYVPTVRNGIDALQETDFQALRGLKLGLITNQTGINAERVSSIDLLHACKTHTLVKLFSPEHGIRGELDQEKITDSKDKKTGLPVLSLYGERKAPTPEQLADIDALVFDIQDMGVRFYTYIATLKECLKAASLAKRKFIVLDRVNPLRGDVIEGCALPAKIEFTSCHALPLRHGMTAGELARMFVAEDKLTTDLQIIRVSGWQRDMWLDTTGLPWQRPSPNMRSLTAATLYPGIGLLEFAISVGRGTETPFEVMGAPWIDDRWLAHELNALGLPGLRFLPERFTPTTSVFSKQDCGGVRIILVDRETARVTDAALAIATLLRSKYGKLLDLEKLDTLMEDPAAIAAIKAGKDWRITAGRWQQEAAAFAERRAAYLLY